MRNNITQRCMLALGFLVSFQSVNAQGTSDLTQVIAKATPIESISLAPIHASVGTPIQVNVGLTGVANHLAPSGTITYTLTLGNGTTAATSIVNISNAPIAHISTALTVWRTTQPSSSYTITAVYSGDTNYKKQTASTSGAIAMDFDFSIDTITVNQGQSLISPMQVVSIGGFSQTVNFACVSPAAFGCTFATSTINPLTSSSLPLTITTVPGQFVAAASLLVGVLLFGALRKRRVLAGVFSIAVVCLTLTLSGCGTNTTVGWQSLTPKGSYQITITGTAGNLQHTKVVTVIVKLAARRGTEEA
jgi:hypothetical protein